MAKRRSKTTILLKPLTFDQAIKELGKISGIEIGNKRTKRVYVDRVSKSKVLDSTEKTTSHRKIISRNRSASS